jgi:hypothetical protein
MHLLLLMTRLQLRRRIGARPAGGLGSSGSGSGRACAACGLAGTSRGCCTGCPGSTALCVRMANALMLHETIVVLVAASTGRQRADKDHVVCHLPDARHGALAYQAGLGLKLRQRARITEQVIAGVQSTVQVDYLLA